MMVVSAKSEARSSMKVLKIDKRMNVLASVNVLVIDQDGRQQEMRLRTGDVIEFQLRLAVERE